MKRANREIDRERSDINVRGVVLAVGALAAITLVAVVLVWRLFTDLSKRDAETSAQPSPTASQPDPVQDLRQLREEEARILEGYRWVDRDAGIARIPIERAMKLIIERGLLNPPPAEPAPPHPAP